MFRPWMLLCALAGCATGGRGTPLDDAEVDASPPDARVGPLELDASADALADAEAKPDAELPDAEADDAEAAVPDAHAPDAALPDATLPDAASPDAALPDATVPDAAGPAIVIDGVISPGEWSGATTTSNTVASNWGGSALVGLRAIARGETLYVAIEGAVEAGTNNAIVLYVDADYGASVGVPDLFALTDGTGALDDAISAGITTPEGFHVENALGIRAMNRAAAGYDGDLGWRDLALNPADFAWIAAEVAPVACTADACEASVPFFWLDHGGSSPVGTLALFARITNHTGAMFSNQCLPEDDAATPNVATQVLLLETD